MNKLSKRLQLIANLVDKKIVADVGCDHGKLTKYLLDSKKVDFAFVSDISASSLKKAEDLLRNYSCVEAICCDGLNGYNGKFVEECIISGMGGEEIIKIISYSPIDINSYILSPQHNIIDVKKFMLNSGYNIVFDIIIRDKDKFYTIMKCVKSDNVNILSDELLYVGKDNFINELSDYIDYIDNELNKLYNIRKFSNVIPENIQKKIQILEKIKKERNL